MGDAPAYEEPNSARRRSAMTPYRTGGGLRGWLILGAASPSSFEGAEPRSAFADVAKVAHTVVPSVVVGHKAGLGLPVKPCVPFSRTGPPRSFSGGVRPEELAGLRTAATGAA
jgi:hypothetical protein